MTHLLLGFEAEIRHIFRPAAMLDAPTCRAVNAIHFCNRVYSFRTQTKVLCLEQKLFKITF